LPFCGLVLRAQLQRDTELLPEEAQLCAKSVCKGGHLVVGAGDDGWNQEHASAVLTVKTPHIAPASPTMALKSFFWSSELGRNVAWSPTII
jgi:hypothetical protein